MKIFKIVLLCMLVVIAGFTGWHFYMKATWDHHLVGTVYPDMQIPVLKNKSTGETRKLTEDEFLTLVKQSNLSNKVEIIKRDKQYYWVSNDSKKLTKRLEQDGSWDFYIYETDDKSEFLKIRYNAFEAGGCAPRPRIYFSNIEIQQMLSFDTVLIYGAYASFYEHPVQYFVCYELMASSSHTILTRFFYYPWFKKGK